MKIFNLTDNQRKVNEHKTHLSDWQRLNMFRKKKTLKYNESIGR